MAYINLCEIGGSMKIVATDIASFTINEESGLAELRLCGVRDVICFDSLAKVEMVMCNDVLFVEFDF